MRGHGGGVLSGVPATLPRLASPGGGGGCNSQCGGFSARPGERHATFDGCRRCAENARVPVRPSRPQLREPTSIHFGAPRPTLSLKPPRTMLGARVYWSQASQDPSAARHPGPVAIAGLPALRRRRGQQGAACPFSTWANFLHEAPRWEFPARQVHPRRIARRHARGRSWASAGSAGTHPPAMPGCRRSPRGLIVGRLGCQFSGLWDGTYGIPTDLPWGLGLWRRHCRATPRRCTKSLPWPCAGGWSAGCRRTRPARGSPHFLAGYCLIRLGVDAVKPPFGGDLPLGTPVTLHAGLTAIQWVALLGFLCLRGVVTRTADARPLARHT